MNPLLAEPGPGVPGACDLSGRVPGRAPCCSLLARAAPARAAERGRERLQVTDPYIELRTGPGRGYPVFFVVARDEWIEIELRHTDWYKVRTDGGKVGWVHRAQLETTLTEAGGTKTFRDIALDDYLARRVAAGRGLGPASSPSRCSSCGPATGCRETLQRSRARSARCRACSRAPTSGTST